MQIDHYFTYQGRSSKDFGLKIRNKLEFPIPEKDVETVKVLGRDGDVVIDNQRYQSVKKLFPCKMFPIDGMTIDEQARKIAVWLRGSVEWSALEFTGYPGYIYQGICFEEFRISDLTRQTGEIEIPFVLHPFKYRKDGVFPLEIKNGTVLQNPEAFTSHPVINIKGSGNITIRFLQGAYTNNLVIQGLPDEIRLDTENGIITRRGENASHMVKAIKLPELLSGETEIEIIGTVSSLEISPRWRTLI